MASSSPSAASASAPRVMRVTTPGAIQVVCYGFFLLTTLFFGTVYILAPYQLVRAAKLPEGSLSPAVEAWVHMVVRGWGAGLLGVAGVVGLVGMYARFVYLTPVLVGGLQLCVYSFGLYELDASVLPMGTVYVHLALGLFYVVLGYSAYATMPAPVTYEVGGPAGVKKRQ